MKIVNKKDFEVAQLCAREAIKLHRNKEYGVYDWAIAMLALKHAYGIYF